MKFSKKIQEKLKELPDKPGVYFMRDRSGKVIYVGKASSLRNRVRHYFQPSTLRKADPKLRGLIKSIAAFDFLPVNTEEQAALTEGKLIKEYRPRYNIDMKDGKRFLMLKVNLHDPYPRFDFCRLRKNDNATYFGPYASSTALRMTREFVEKEFRLRPCRPRIPGERDYKHCHNDIIRYCSAPCIGRISQAEYRECVAEACRFLRAERPKYIKRLTEEMQHAAQKKDYERAAALRDTIGMLRQTIEQRIRAPKSLRVKAQEALEGVADLQKSLGLNSRPRRIECYDISNISGTHAVGSMVCAIDGRPQRNRYRHFRIKTVEGSDDPQSMAEVIRRRFTRALDEGAELPDLVVCDGGITQVRATQATLNEIGQSSIPVIGLAKRYEEIVRDRESDQETLTLPKDSKALRVLQNLRDEAHRFAITYHRKLRNKRIQESALDDIPGIGSKKKQMILQQFSSVHRLSKTSLEELQSAPGIGPKTAALIYQHLHTPGD